MQRSVAIDGPVRVEQHALIAEALLQPGTPHDFKHVGLQADQPDRDAALGCAPLAFDQRLQGRIFDVGNTTQVQRQDGRLVLRDQCADPVGNVLRVGEEEAPDGPQDQQALEGLVVGCSADSGRRTSVPRLRPITSTAGFTA